MITLTVPWETSCPDAVCIDGQTIEAYIDHDEYGEWVQYPADIKIGEEEIKVEIYAEPRYVRATYDKQGEAEYIYEKICKLGEEEKHIMKAIEELEKKIKEERNR